MAPQTDITGERHVSKHYWLDIYGFLRQRIDILFQGTQRSTSK